MKKIITPLFMAASALLSAQNAEHIQVPPNENGIVRCAQVQYENYLRSQDPNFDAKRAEVDKVIREGAEKFMMQNAKGGNPQPFTQYTIPIVFHVLYNTSAQNVSDTQIGYALQQLNEDWSRTNSDAGNTPSVWQPIAANMQIQYCLATKDPNGAPTNGIVHKQTSQTSFTTDDKIKQSANGGDDPWDVNKYLNIWIGNLGGGLLGYGQFPPISASYGTVVHYISIGSLTHQNSAGGAFGYGRTLSHEIGHCFNLYHIWGDDSGACTGSDQCTDTPNMADATSGCPSGVQTDACGAGSDGSPASNAAPGRMYQNIMDYTDDLCYNMFTNGQKARCQSAISSYLMTIANNAATVCGPAAALDAGVNNIASPSGVACSLTFTPSVTLTNYGATTLTSCQILYHVDASANQTYNWNGSLATGNSATVTLPSITTTAGTHSFTASSSAPNSSTDGNTSNDATTSVFTVATVSSPPVQEPFASATPFPPGKWTINNPDGASTWTYNAVNYPTSTGGSMYMDNFNYNANGQTDDFVSTPLNLQFATSPTLKFQIAYQLYTDPSTSPNFSDTLEVQTSTNCGASWTSIYKKYGTQLTTTTPTFSTNQFAPASASDWRLETLSLPTAASVLVRFHHTTDYENEMYIDDINISASNNAVNENNLSDYISVYPNPSAGKMTITHMGIEINAVDVYNVVGEKVYSVINPAHSLLDISDKASGVYFIHINTAKGSVVKKIVMNK